VERNAELEVPKRVARATSATTSRSTVAHPADSSYGLPDADAIVKCHSPKSGREREIDGHAPSHRYR
jgi:hypothetical protein